MALPILLCFLDWFIYEGVFFTRQRPPSPLAPLPTSLLVPSPLLTACPSFSWGYSDLRSLVSFFPWRDESQESPLRAVPRPLSCSRTHGQ